jgi:hypothetical protein
MAWTPRPLRLEIGGALWSSADAHVAGSAIGGSFSAVSGGGRVCRVWPVGAFELGPCAAFDLAEVHARGFGAMTNIPADVAWGIVSAGGDAAWPIARPLALRLRVDGTIPTSRPSFVLLEPDHRVLLHRASAIGIRAAIGVETRFF